MKFFLLPDWYLKPQSNQYIPGDSTCMATTQRLGAAVHQETRLRVRQDGGLIGGLSVGLDLLQRGVSCLHDDAPPIEGCTPPGDRQPVRIVDTGSQREYCLRVCVLPNGSYSSGGCSVQGCDRLFRKNLNFECKAHLKHAQAQKLTSPILIFVLSAIWSVIMVLFYLILFY